MIRFLRRSRTLAKVLERARPFEVLPIAGKGKSSRLINLFATIERELAHKQTNLAIPTGIARLRMSCFADAAGLLRRTAARISGLIGLNCGPGRPQLREPRKWQR